MQLELPSAWNKICPGSDSHASVLACVRFKGLNPYPTEVSTKTPKEQSREWLRSGATRLCSTLPSISRQGHVEQKALGTSSGFLWELYHPGPKSRQNRTNSYKLCRRERPLCR